jgi:hypothetical protein
MHTLKIFVSLIVLLLLATVSSCVKAGTDAHYVIPPGKSVVIGAAHRLQVGATQVNLSHAVCSFWSEDPGVFLTRVKLAKGLTAEQLREFEAFETEVEAMYQAGQPLPGDGPSLYLEIVGEPEIGDVAEGRLIGYGFNLQKLPFSATDMTKEFFRPFGSRDVAQGPSVITFHLGTSNEEPASTNYDFGRLESLLPQADLILYGKVESATPTTVDFELRRVLRGNASGLRLDTVVSSKRSAAQLHGCISDLHWPVGQTCCLFLREGSLVNYGDGIQVMPYGGAVDIEVMSKIVKVWDDHLRGLDLDTLQADLDKRPEQQRLIIQIVNDQPTLQSKDSWMERIEALREGQ